jgi:2-oxoglutarate dehydrogenase complex dehydrogenase (E1) component-like enzyme
MSAKWLLHHRACTSRVEDFGPGTYFHRVIFEGGRGDNMRDGSALSDAESEEPLTTAQNSDGSSNINSDNSDASTLGVDNETLMSKSSGNVDEPQTSSGGYQLVGPSKIRRVLFCSGKIFYHLFHARSAAGIRDVTIVRVEQVAPFPYDLIGQAVQRFPNADLVWVQEEPKNMGAWSYVKPRFDTALREAGLHTRQPIRYVGRSPSSSPATGGYTVHVEQQKKVVERALSLE